MSKRPLWNRREEVLRQSTTTPRDFVEGDPWLIKKPAGTAKHCRFLWMSERMWERRPSLVGFRYDNWQPVTPDVAAELGVETGTKDRTPDGVPRSGDAFLMWCPENVAKEFDDFVLEGAKAQERMQDQANEYRDAITGTSGSGPIGDVVVTDDERELVEAEALQRQELGAKLGRD